MSGALSLLLTGVVVFAVCGVMLCLVGGFLFKTPVWFRTFRSRLWGFVLLFGLGVVLYFINPVASGHSQTDCCSCVVTNAAASGKLQMAGRFFESMNRTASTFFPSRGDFEDVGEPKQLPGRAWWTLIYHVFHFLVVLYVVSLALSIFGQLFLNKLRRWWWRKSSPAGSGYVFWGDGDAARILAEDVVNEARKKTGCKTRVLFLLPGDLRHDDKTRHVVGWLSRKGYTVDFVNDLVGCGGEDSAGVTTDGRRNSLSIGLEDDDLWGRYHFILGEDSGFNVLLANAIVEHYRRTGLTHPLDLYVRVENSVADGNLHAWADNIAKGLPNLMVHVVCETALMAAAYIDDYPILWGRSNPLIRSDVTTGLAEGEARILLIGFGNRGQQLLNVMIENSQFLGAEKEDGAGREPVPVSFDVVDGDDGTRLRYCERCPEVFPCYNVKFSRMNALGEDFRKEFLDCERLFSYGRIIVTTGDDELNVKIGDVIRSRFLRSGRPLGLERLFVQLQSKDVYERVKAAYGRVSAAPGVAQVGLQAGGIEFFGVWNRIFTVENMIGKVTEYGARLLNWRYCQPEFVSRPKDAAEVNGEWRKATWLNRESSWASFRGERSLMALLGFEKVGQDSHLCDASDQFAECIEDEKVMDVLAQDEHLRWMAFERTHGILAWDLSSPGLETVSGLLPAGGKLKANAIALIGRHAALVPYDRLPDVDLALMKFNSPDVRLNRKMFVGRGSGPGFQANMQWNDIRFVGWIPELVEHLWNLPEGRQMIVRPLEGVKRHE